MLFGINAKKVENYAKKGNVKGLLNALTNENETMQLLSIKHLGQINDPKSIEALINLLGDKNETISKAAVKSLIDLNSSNVLEMLILKLDHLKGISLIRAIEVLGSFKEDCVVDGASIVTSGGGDEKPIADYMNYFLITTGIHPGYRSMP